MTRQMDGPADGIYYCTRTPAYLRAVIRNDPPAGATDCGSDVLKQIGDTPEPGESGCADLTFERLAHAKDGFLATH